MKSFIENHQYQYIKSQIENLLQSKLTTHDTAVTEAIKTLTQEKVTGLFGKLSEDQKQLVDQVQHVEDEAEAIFFLSRLKQHVTPFPELHTDTIQSLFPKAKKLRLPDLESVDWNELSYFGWNDQGSGKKYIILFKDGKLIGIEGRTTFSQKPGICSICHEQEDVNLFTTSVKRSSKEESITRANYICRNSNTCNRNLKNIHPLHRFIDLMT
ncbi:FusB/FusC family EF-G-binding protein [Halobacillus yeomjeoni]|uniref:FusB/FusC family EF-G-binding protein n=1 Tax=Halobacillus yeomjeoni TaxID=311194 RepID=A0A931HU64_9BACI|nr:FusB/FusC family EF-G-binding protein [Halobacillus yeomjeoni]MBH0229747.1 FusB/FusC family EF-G-binding protein [Halobacillus yeomjeoni]